MAAHLIKAVSLLLICRLSAASEAESQKQTLREAEVEIVQEKLQLYREKLELLKQLKAEQLTEGDEPQNKLDSYDSEIQSAVQSGEKQIKAHKDGFDNFKKQGYYEYFRSSGQNILMGERHVFQFKSLGATEAERKPLKIKKFKFIASRAFTHGIQNQKELRGNIIIAAILEGNTIALATVDGTELMRITDVMDYAYGTKETIESETKAQDSDDRIVDIATMPQPGQADDGAFGILTQKGKLVMYHYSIIDTKQSYLKHLTQQRKMDENAEKALNPNPESAQKLTPEERNKRLNEDKAEADTYKSPFMVIRSVDSVDIIKHVNEKYELMGKKDPSGSIHQRKTVYEERENFNLAAHPTPKFNHLIMTLQKSLRLFAATDDQGFITTVTRGAKLGNRFKSNMKQGDQYIGFGHFVKMPMTVQPNGVALIDLLEGKHHTYFCETGDNNPDWKLQWAEPDESRNGKKYVFALKTRTLKDGRLEHELMQFNVKLTSSRADSTECRLLGKYMVPQPFTLGKAISFTVMKESILFQNTAGFFMAVDSSPNTLLANQIVKTHTTSFVKEGKKIKPCQLELTQASTASTRNFKSKQSLVLSRLPDDGESTSLALFEYHGRALTPTASFKEDLDDGWSSGSSALMFVFGFGFLVYIMVQKNLDRKKDHKKNQLNDAISNSALSDRLGNRADLFATDSKKRK